MDRSISTTPPRKLSFEHFSIISPVGFAENEQEPSSNCDNNETLFCLDAGYPSEHIGSCFEAAKIKNIQV